MKFKIWFVLEKYIDIFVFLSFREKELGYLREGKVCFNIDEGILNLSVSVLGIMMVFFFVEIDSD